jgi:hypothetical protein
LWLAIVQLRGSRLLQRIISRLQDSQCCWQFIADLWHRIQILRRVVGISSLLRRRCHVLVYVQRSLAYYYRTGDRKMDDGKNKKDSSDHLVPMHCRGIMWRELDDVISWVIKNERSVVRTTKSSSQTKWAENRRRLGIIWPIEAEK